MEAAIHRFIRFLRLRGIRVSVAEAVDGLRAAAQPGVLADREVLRAALAVSLVKDRRDLEGFDAVFIAGGLAAEETGTQEFGIPDPERLAAWLSVERLEPKFTMGLLR